MRRMYSDGQVVKVVNKAIEEGEIQAGGLTPEQKEKIDNALQLPESAPAAQQLVGINTSGEQNSLTVGEGFFVEEDQIKLKRLTLNFNNQKTLQLTEAIANNISSKFYDEIIILNYDQTSYYLDKLCFSLKTDPSATFNSLINGLRGDFGHRSKGYCLEGSYIMPNTALNTSSDFYETATGIHKTFISYSIYLDINASYVLSLKSTVGEKLNNIYSYLRKPITLASTTQTGTLDYPYWTQYFFEKFSSSNDPKALFDIVIPLVDDIDSSNPFNIYMRAASSLALGGSGYAYFYGERVEDSGVTYKYIMKIAPNKTYTINRVAA